MRVTFTVNQVSALRAGIDAPSSTVVIEIDPAALTVAQREVLSDALRDGHIADVHVWSVDRRHTYEQLSIVEPTYAGVVVALDLIVVERTKTLAEDEALDAARSAKRRRIIERVMVDLEKWEEVAVQAGPGAGATVRVPIEISLSTGGLYLSNGDLPDDLRRLVAARRELRESLTTSARESLRRPIVAAAEARAAVDKAARAALYARLPESLRDRDAAGYAGDEAADWMLWLARRDAGYELREEWVSRRKVTSLTDEEFQRFRDIEREAPEGATVELWDFSDVEGAWRYRNATDEDDPCDIDCDGEVYVEPGEERRVALISWHVGDMEVEATVRLSAADD